MADRQMERYSKFLIIKEVKVKTTVSYGLAPAWTATAKKTEDKCRRGRGRMGKSVHCRWERDLEQPLSRPVWRVLKKLK